MVFMPRSKAQCKVQHHDLKYLSEQGLSDAPALGLVRDAEVRQLRQPYTPL